MVDIRVEQDDALTRSTDVLVLKYAQALHGLDRAAVEAMGGVDTSALPRIGETLHLRRPSGLGAQNLLMFGVEKLSRLDYPELRRFGAAAISSACQRCPDAREVCVTLHGTGVGLDESEAFDAEIAGVLEAIDQEDAGGRLDRVVVVDRSGARVKRLRALLPDRMRAQRPPEAGLERPVDRHRFSSAGLDSVRKPHAFVAMPFADEWDEVFQIGIKEPLQDIGMACGNMKEEIFTGDIVATLRARIEQADVVIAEITDANPNVYLEVGYAWALGKPMVLLCRTGQESPFDIRNQAQLRYGGLVELRKKLTSAVTGLVAGVNHSRSR